MPDETTSLIEFSNENSYEVDAIIDRFEKQGDDFFMCKGFRFQRIKNSLKNYRAGDPVHEDHLSSKQIIGYAWSDSTWRDDYIWIARNVYWRVPK